MRKDFILDALNDLDEDLISEANQCRRTRKHHDKRWIVPVAVAASFCIVVSVLFYRGGFGLPAQNSENIAATGDGDQQISMQENTEGEPENHEEYVQECPSVIVTLENWTENGFTGTVTELVDTDTIPLGSRVAVKTDSNTILSVYDESMLLESMHLDSKMNNFSTIEATKFQIVFRPWNDDGFAEDTESACYIYAIYAEQIIPIEDGAE